MVPDSALAMVRRSDVYEMRGMKDRTLVDRQIDRQTADRQQSPLGSRQTI